MWAGFPLVKQSSPRFGEKQSVNTVLSEKTEEKSR